MEPNTAGEGIRIPSKPTGIQCKIDWEFIKRAVNTYDDLLKASKAIIRDYEDEDSKMIIDPSSCTHFPNHTDLCPYWLARQAVAKTKRGTN